MASSRFQTFRHTMIKSTSLMDSLRKPSTSFSTMLIPSIFLGLRRKSHRNKVKLQWHSLFMKEMERETSCFMVILISNLIWKMDGKKEQAQLHQQSLGIDFMEEVHLMMDMSHSLSYSQSRMQSNKDRNCLE